MKADSRDGLMLLGWLVLRIGSILANGEGEIRCDSLSTTMSMKKEKMMMMAEPR